MNPTSIIHREPQPCIILDLRCTNCGPVRMAVSPEEAAPAEMPCPFCETPAETKPLGTGMTRNILPYFDLAPNVKALDSVQTFTPNARFINTGQIVCFSEDPDKYHFARVQDVYTSRAHVTNGRPSVSFIIAGEEVGPFPHVSGAETRPWWCWPDELPKKPAEAANLSGQCAKRKCALCRAKVCGCGCHAEGATR